jgi:CRP/FNR family transcriptional regulator, cyclic AMP receptor protein
MAQPCSVGAGWISLLPCGRRTVYSRRVASGALVSAARAAAASEPAGRGSARAWAGVLAEIPLFAHVSGRHVRKIASLGTVVRYESGAWVVRRGQDGDAFYVVLDGRATVTRSRGLPDVRIGAGGYFGEMALLDGRPRSATVVAATELTCLRLGRSAFQKALRAEPQLSTALLRSLAERIRKLEDAATA